MANKTGSGQFSHYEVLRRRHLFGDLEHILERTAHLWEELRGQRLFLTGCTGFLGCWLLESFIRAQEALNLNAFALVLTRDQEAFRRKAPHLYIHPAISFHTGDVRSFEFPRGPFSHIIHAATQSSTNLNAENPLLMLDTIIQGTRNTLEFARHCGAQKFLYVSSGAVYGRQPARTTHMPEDYPGGPDPVSPEAAYGEGKRAAEFLCSCYARNYGLETKIARCFAFVGPYLPMNAHFAVGNFIRDGLAGGPIKVTSDGTSLRSYLYAADLAIWLWTILFKGAPLRPYNVGSEQALTIGELAHIVARVFNPPRKVHIAEAGDPDKSPDRYIPSTQRARQELGLQERVDLVQAIQKTINWHQGVEGTA
jgi:dTDP-glucose 4,6-dehydratase